MNTTKQQQLKALEGYMEYLFIANIVEFFDKYGEKTSESSEFMKAAYVLHKMVKDKKPVEEIIKYAEELKKKPISYGDMRSLFG